MAAASSKPIASRSGKTWAVGTAIASAYPPKRVSATTRRPTARSPSAPGPSASRPRDLVADDARPWRRVGIEPETRHHIGEVDAGGADPDQRLARAGHRIRGLAD